MHAIQLHMYNKVQHAVSEKSEQQFMVVSQCLLMVTMAKPCKSVRWVAITASTCAVMETWQIACQPASSKATCNCSCVRILQPNNRVKPCLQYVCVACACALLLLAAYTTTLCHSN